MELIGILFDRNAVARSMPMKLLDKSIFMYGFIDNNYLFKMGR